MSRRLSEESFQKILAGKKIDRQATADAWKDEEGTAPEITPEHPLVAQGKALLDQGKAMEGAVRDLGQALMSQGGEVAAMAGVLSSLIEQNNTLIKDMATKMMEMHKDTRLPEKPYKTTITVNRDSDGFIETLYITHKG